MNKMKFSPPLNWFIPSFLRQQKNQQANMSTVLEHSLPCLRTVVFSSLVPFKFHVSKHFKFSSLIFI